MNEDIVGDISAAFDAVDMMLDTEFVEEVVDIEAEILNPFSSGLDNPDLKSQSNDVISQIQSEMVSIDSKKVELENQLSTAHIKDASFLEMELKSLILSSKRVLETLESDIKIGAQPRMYEVYATLLNAITGQYKELRSLNESIGKFVLENKKQNLEVAKEDHKVGMDSRDALKMYMKAKEDSQMDAVDTDFDIVGD